MSAELQAEAGYAPLADVTVYQPSRARVEALGLTSLAAVFALDGERRSPQKSLVRLRDDAGQVFVKRWDYDRREVWLKATLKGFNYPVFSGPQELRNLRRLAAAGQADTGWRRRSFVALAALPGQPLDQLGVSPVPAVRRQRAAELAALVQALHAAGCWHKDLYLCNVFWDPAAGLGLLDCERVDHDPAGVPRRWRVKDLAALASSAPGGRHGWTCADRLRFLRAYLGDEAWSRDGKALAEDVWRKAERLTRHGQKGPGRG